MPPFTLTTAPQGRAVHLTPEGAPQSWCGRRADQPERGPVRLGAICRRCWASAPAAWRSELVADATEHDACAFRTRRGVHSGNAVARCEKQGAGERAEGRSDEHVGA
ncbi:hypothetical protein, partial [Methylobacterium frigidaeris]